MSLTGSHSHFWPLIVKAVTGCGSTNLTVGVKMAPCGRSRLLLPLTLLCLCGSGSVLGAKAASRAAEPPNQAAHRGAEPAKDAPAAAAAGASAPRRATGWKLAEEEACREDLSRLCPRHTWANNLAVLECLQDRREVRAQPAEPAGSPRC